VSDFGLHPSRDEAIADPDATTRALPAPVDRSESAPKSREILQEIGVVLALHLAFALVVLLTLRAVSVS
jgi:hypothetical protein